MKLKKIIKKIISKFYKELNATSQLKLHNFITSEKNDETEIKPKIFDAIFFELRTRCNSKCNFCAASIQNEIRPDITMPFQIYKKAIDELSELNYSNIIAYHVNNDPLLVKNLLDYVKYAREKVPNAWIQILTNGKSLNNKNGEELIKNGINELSINIYSDKDEFELPKNIIKFENEVLYRYYKKENIESTENNISFIDDTIEIKKKSKIFIYNKYKRSLGEILTNRANSSPNKKINKIPKLGFCYFPFSQFNVTVSGVVSHCCADFYFSNEMGNIKNQKLIDIWNGDKFVKIRRNLKNHNRDEETMCAGCDNFGVNKPKDVFKKILYQMTNNI